MSSALNAADETALRCDLAAAYRLAARFGWDDTLYTHFSVRLPSPAGQERFLLNPFGLMFDEVCASDLIVVDARGHNVAGDAKLNPAGFTIHSAVHMARDDAHCVIHTHTLAGMAVAACERGLLQLNQISAEFFEGVGYHPYEGVATNLEERSRLQAALGNKAALILRHHGLLTVGSSVADAFYVMFYLNRACEIQLACAQLAGLGVAGAVTEIAPPVSAYVRQQLVKAQHERPLIWAAWLRQLERSGSNYKN
ncbi:class II aldolase [Rhodoferax lacus]|uniref:Class II aldolase n=1 Tax=Rhodoferax lacus TaxID=2184758 RepID=A0A3E1RBA7_9BURK|nr:class II aldolase/adducin family protein [Rhodoferax lacus]RFO96637.1 class II aldolase [Rhodoferax lacus]